MKKIVATVSATALASGLALAGGCLPPASPAAPSGPSSSASTASAITFAPRANCEGMAQVPGGNLPSVGGEARSAVVQPFCIDKTEVTVAAYEACVRAGKCTPAGDQQSGLSAATGESCNRSVPGREQHPINCVDWAQANARR